MRKIVNLVNEKKILEMQVRMLSRVLIKVLSKKMKVFYSDLKVGVQVKEKRQ